MTALLEEVGRLLSERLGSLAATTLTERCFALLEKSPLSMYDDGGDPTGMPFLFDLKGSAKKRLDLVAEGAGYPLPLGRTSPHHQTGCFSAGGDEVQLTNLFLKPGEASLQDLLSSAGDGVWISALRRLVCFDSDTLYFRAEGRGLRRIHQGRIAEALPDQAITGTLPELFGRVRQVGKASLSRALGEGIFGAATAPAVLLENLGD